MFLFRSHKSDSASKKDQSYLERRLYLAEHTPEPVFDLSDCGLNKVPAGVVAKCRALRKTTLNLNNNVLTSIPDLRELVLLMVLSVSSNQLKKLPDSIGCLVNLEILDVHSNQLTELPTSLSKLKSLRTLDVSDNKLSFLPQGVRSLGCDVRADGCPLLEQLEPQEKSSGCSPDIPDTPDSQLVEDVELVLGNVWERRERMLKELRHQKLDVEQRLYELTMNEYEKRDKRQKDNIISIAQERVELAANLNSLILKKEVERSEFRSAGVSMQFEDSGVADRDCVVCLENGFQLIVLVPCGHICVCRNCAEKLTVCPLCGQAMHTDRASRS